MQYQIPQPRQLHVLSIPIDHVTIQITRYQRTSKQASFYFHLLLGYSATNDSETSTLLVFSVVRQSHKQAGVVLYGVCRSISPNQVTVRAGKGNIELQMSGYISISKDGGWRMIAERGYAYAFVLPGTYYGWSGSWSWRCGYERSRDQKIKRSSTYPEIRSWDIIMHVCIFGVCAPHIHLSRDLWSCELGLRAYKLANLWTCELTSLVYELDSRTWPTNLICEFTNFPYSVLAIRDRIPYIPHIAYYISHTTIIISSSFLHHQSSSLRHFYKQNL